jgi:hypothetical protein
MASLVDPAGFVTLATIRDAITRTGLSMDDFEQKSPAPALRFQDVVAMDPQAPPAMSWKDDLSKTMSDLKAITPATPMGLVPQKRAASRYRDRVAFLTKKPKVPFPQMITIGRALNNDVVVALDTVSKLHGYFMKTGDNWFYMDHGSANGSFIKGARISAKEKHALTAGTEIQIGREVKAMFLPPRELYLLCKKAP